MAGVNFENVDDLSGYSDIVRYCIVCKQGKTLTDDNFAYDIVDMFKKSKTCRQCETVKKMDKI